MKSRRFALVTVVFLVVGFLSLSALLLGRSHGGSSVSSAVPDVLPVLDAAPEIHLTDSTGQPFDRQHLDGRVWVVDFIFTTCPGPCPIMTARMAGLFRNYQGNDGVRFVSVSVDPETDTPEVLTKYASQFGAYPAKWYFLTGDLSEVKRVMDAFRLGTGGDMLNHSVRFVLVDRNNRVRGYYQGTDPHDVEALSRDIRRLLAETPA